MTAPGHRVILGERPASPFSSAGPATGFLAGIAKKGSTVAPTLVVSLSDFITKCGERNSVYPQVYDGVEAAFQEGARQIYIARVIGESAVTASGDIVDGSAKKVLKATATSPGEWANTITLDVTLTGEELAIVVKLGGTVVESFAGMTGNAGAIAYVNANSQYIRLAANEAGSNAKSQTGVEVKGGKDELASANNKQLGIALETLTRDLGPGQLAAPGFIAEAEHKTMVAHCVANNRRALLDYPDTAEASATAALSSALRTLPEKGARYAQGLAPWAIIPGLTTGTFRTIPYSGVQMGLIARAEAEGNSAGDAVAGNLGVARFAVGLSQAYTDAQRDTLNSAGVSCAIVRKGQVKTYGNRTLVNPVTEPDWKSFAASRVIMAIAALADGVMEDYDFATIDGQGYVFRQLAGDLGGRACAPLFAAGALYGATPGDAYQVNTGPDVNTPATIANEEIRAQIAARVSPSGEVLVTEVVKVRITELV